MPIPSQKRGRPACKRSTYRALPSWIGQELQAYYVPPAGLPHAILTVLIQVNGRGKATKHRGRGGKPGNAGK
jgi:hypothetical protein